MAACELAKQGYKIVPEVMIPLIGTIQEFEIIEEYCRKTAEQVMAEAGVV